MAKKNILKLEYLGYISNTLKSFKIERSGKIKKRYYKKFNCYSYHYNSHSYPELLTIRKQWYPEGKKIVPRDIKLTPLTVRQWYIGDGSLFRQRYISLAICGFTILDTEWLVGQLDKLGFKANRCKNTIGLSVKSTKEFLNYIGECPVECYKYKWNYKDKGGE